MTVEWLDDEMKTARLVRGFWRWKRTALVRREPGQWSYVPTGDAVEHDISEKIEAVYWSAYRARSRREKAQRNWQPVAEPPPRARLVLR